MNITIQETVHQNKGLVVFKQISKDDRCPERERPYLIQGHYVSAREFGGCLCTATQCGDFCCYLYRFLTPELLIIDGAEYFAGKDSTQQFLYSLLKQRVTAAKTTVIISELSLEHLSYAICGELIPFLSIETYPTTKH